MLTGLPLPADLIGTAGFFDYPAATLKAEYAALGVNAAGETSTAAVKSYAFYANVLSLLPNNPSALQAAGNFAMRNRWDKKSASECKFILPMDSQIAANMPGGRNLTPSGGHATDGHLLRLNACHAGVPLPFPVTLAAGKLANNSTATSGTTLTDSAQSFGTLTGYTVVSLSGTTLTSALITSNSTTALTASGGWSAGTPTVGANYLVSNTPSVAAVTNVNGALPNVVVGSAPYIVACVVGTNDYDESWSTPVAARAALTGTQNGYQFTLNGNAPAMAPRKIGLYRTLMGGSASGPYYWDHDEVVQVAGGAAWSGQPPMYLLKSDVQLRTDVQPPVFMSAPMLPEAAFQYACGIGIQTPTTNSTVYYNPNPPLLTAGGMLNPANVVLNPSNAFLGLGNNTVPSTAILGTQVIGTGFTAGSIQTANNPTGGIQGFAGAYGGAGTAAFHIQARATATLNGTRHSVISYNFYDSFHPGSAIQTATNVACDADFVGGIAGETVTFTIPAGRLVTAVTAETTGSGTATAGSYIWEAQAARSI